MHDDESETESESIDTHSEVERLRRGLVTVARQIRVSVEDLPGAVVVCEPIALAEALEALAAGGTTETRVKAATARRKALVEALEHPVRRLRVATLHIKRPHP